MAAFRRSIDIRAPVEKVFAFHLDPANLARIAPPESKTEILSRADHTVRSIDRTASSDTAWTQPTWSSAPQAICNSHPFASSHAPETCSSALRWK